MVEQSFWEMLRTKRDSLTKSGGIVADYLVQHAEDASIFPSPRWQMPAAWPRQRFSGSAAHWALMATTK